MTESVCPTEHPAVPKAANLTSVIRMVLAGDLHNAAVLLAQGGMMKSFSGRCVAWWMTGRLLRRSRWHLKQMNVPAALDAIDDARMVAGPAGQRWVAVQLTRALEKIQGQCNQLLNSGNCKSLDEILEELGRRGLHSAETAVLFELARNARRSEVHAAREKWVEAITILEKLRAHSPPIPWIVPRLKWLRDRKCASGLNVTNPDLLSSTIVIQDSAAAGHSGTKRSLPEGPVPLLSLSQSASGTPYPKRLLLWIDGIGHYLLCLEPEIWIGRYVPLSGIQVPVLADIGRRHVRLFRDESGAVHVQAHWPTSLASNETESVLNNDVQIRRQMLNAQSQPAPIMELVVTLELGERVELEYSRPEPDRAVIIRTVSGHRTVPAANAVVWVDRRLTIGGDSGSDIHCPNRMGKIELEFGEDGVFVTGAECVSVPATTGPDKPAICRAGIRIKSSDISLVLEPLQSGQEIPFAGSLQTKSFQTKSESGNRGSFRIE